MSLEYHGENESPINGPSNFPKLIDRAIESGDLNEMNRLFTERIDLLEYRDPVLLSNFVHVAAGANRPIIIEWLVGRGLSIDIRDSQGLTPLHWAAQNSCVEAAEQLLRCGANPHIVDDDGWTPLTWSVSSHNSPGRTVADVLMSHGVVLDLYAALALGRLDDVRRLIRTPDAALKTSRQDVLLTSTIILIATNMFGGDLIRISTFANSFGGQTVVPIKPAEDFLDILDSLLAQGVSMKDGYNALVASIEYIPDPIVAKRLLAAGVSQQLTQDDPRLDKLIRLAEQVPAKKEFFNLFNKHFKVST